MPFFSLPTGGEVSRRHHLYATHRSLPYHMTNDAFAAALVLAAIPAGMASGMFGVWLYRTLIAALVAH